MEIEIEPEDWTIIVADEKEYEEYYQEHYEYLEKGEEQHTDPEGTECTWKDQIIHGEFRIPVLHSSHEVMRGKKETFHCLEINNQQNRKVFCLRLHGRSIPIPCLHGSHFLILNKYWFDVILLLHPQVMRKSARRREIETIEIETIDSECAPDTLVNLVSFCEI